MGIIKFEVEIPEFDKELNINITLKKDGKVVEVVNNTPTTPTPPAPKKTESKKKATSSESLLGGGNMMNLDF